MKKSRLTEEQMVAMLREAVRTTVADVSRKHKVSDAFVAEAWEHRFVFSRGALRSKRQAPPQRVRIPVATRIRFPHNPSKLVPQTHLPRP